MAARRRWKGWGAIAVALLALAFALRAWMRVPLAADQPAWARFAAPDGRTPPAVEVTPIVLGKSPKPRCGLAGEASRFRLADVAQAAFLVRHPRGTFLVDSGIGRIDDDLAHMPWLMRKLLAVDIPAGIDERLRELGAKIDFVLPTHAHWDHTSGIAALPGIEVRLTDAELAFVRTSTDPGVMRWHLDGARVTTDYAERAAAASSVSSTA